jgi:hypothetical protein
MPTPQFATVALVAVEENIDAFTVGLAEDQAGEGACLILQCALTPPTDQDAATGLDSYCLMDEDGAVQYGGVLRAQLVGRTLRLDLTDEAAAELGVETEDNSLTLTLALAVPPDSVARLSAGLRRVLTYGNASQQPELIGI